MLGNTRTPALPDGMTTMVPYPARIRAWWQESDDTRTYELALRHPVPALDAALPGQFVMLSLLGAGEAAFTLARLPRVGAEPGTITLTIRRMGALTRALFACNLGARVGVRGPFGRGFPIEGLDRPTLYVAGGCGLAPVQAAIDHQVACRRPGTPLAILYGARTPATRILRSSLAAWRGLPDVTVIECVDHADAAWDGATGLVADLVGDAVRAIGAERAVLCGPPAMLAAVADRLTTAGLAPAAIHVALERYMKCGTGLCGHCYVNDRYVCQDGPVFSLAELAALPEAFGRPEDLAGRDPSHC